MIKLNIDVTKIPKDRIQSKPEWKGKFINLILVENRNGKDERGNDGFISVDVTKEEREAGTRGVIVGNWKNLGSGGKASSPAPKPAPTKQADPDLDAESSEIPF